MDHAETTRATPNSLFQILTNDEWEHLRGCMEPRSFKPGDVLVAQGTMEVPFQVIVEGITSVAATDSNGDRHEIGRLGPGECIGEMALLTGEPASADVVALTDVQSYCAPFARLATIGGLRSRLIEALSAILAGRLKHANERLLAVHAARNHVIRCEPEDIGALAQLPAAMTLTAGARVLVLIVGEALMDAATRAGLGGKNVAIRGVREDELVELPKLLHHAAHEFDEILTLGTSNYAGVEPASALWVVREESLQRFAVALPAERQLIVVGRERWTQPALRRLSARFGAEVRAVIPPVPVEGVPGTAVAKLARVLTGRLVGVALGAGAAKGLAHLGVLRALDELRVPIDVIAGCSIGSAIAAGAAAGMGVDELMEATDRVAAKAVRPTVPLHSFLSNAGIREGLRSISGERRFEDLELPLAVVATDLYRRTAVTFTTGLIWPKLLASMAIPGVYPPSPGLGSYLVDGGVLHPVPVRQCRELGAGLVIGVRLTGSRTSPRDSLDETPHRPLAIETIMRSLEIMVNRISEVSHENADVNIEVCVDGGGGVRDFKRSAEIASVGYRTVMDGAPEIALRLPYIYPEVA
jgi:NTE family protein